MIADGKQNAILGVLECIQQLDPYETIQHAKRVGAYSAELYEAWAVQHGVHRGEIRKTEDILRTAAILHDVGKAEVSEAIFNKPRNQLSDDEMNQLRLHTILGARIFAPSQSPWDKMAAEVTLSHHENWDGSGYPGQIDDIYAANINLGPGKQGSEIPLPARIVAIADVYDALISERSYKPEWKQKEALRYIRHQAGKKFDPELAKLFANIADLLAAISNVFP